MSVMVHWVSNDARGEIHMNILLSNSPLKCLEELVGSNSISHEAWRDVTLWRAILFESHRNHGRLNYPHLFVCQSAQLTFGFEPFGIGSYPNTQTSFQCRIPGWKLSVHIGSSMGRAFTLTRS